MVDSNVVLSRITKIRECVAILRNYARLTEKSFLASVDISGNAERQLQVAIQAVIDIGNHVISDMDSGAAKDYKDIFRVLAKQRIVSAALSRRLAAMTGLRNILVHDYLDVDLKIVYRILRKIDGRQLPLPDHRGQFRNRSLVDRGLLRFAASPHL